MKKLILPILLFMMFIPFIVNAETCDTDKISISSITVAEKSDNVEELDEATASGKNLNLNLSMSEVGDNIEYKIVVKNDSNEDYELDKNSFNISSDYIAYTLESDDNSNIVKANSSKTVYLKVEYKTEVPEDAFESGTYYDNKTVTVNLSTGDTINVPDTLKNPNTGVQSYIIIFILILIISVISYVILRKKKYAQFMVLIVGTAIIIPISVYALCKCEIKVESNVTIEQAYPVNYIIYDKIKTSEKGNYNIFNFSDFGVDKLSCEPIEGQDEYELCAIIELTEMHTPGDTVTMQNEITYHAFNINGELIEYTVPTDHTIQYGICDKPSGICDYKILNTEILGIQYWWIYYKDLNHYNDIDEMNFKGYIENYWNSSQDSAIHLYSPNSFTMPNHGVFFENSYEGPFPGGFWRFANR